MGRGDQQDRRWCGVAPRGPLFGGLCHATCSSKTRKSAQGQGERLEQNLPAPWQCPGEGGCPTGARPHLCTVPLMKPEAPSLGRCWPLGWEQSGEHKQVAKAAMGLPQGASHADAPLCPVTWPVMTQSHGSAPAQGLQVTRLLRLLPAAPHREPDQRSCSSGQALFSQAPRARQQGDRCPEALVVNSPVVQSKEWWPVQVPVPCWHWRQEK